MEVTNQAIDINAQPLHNSAKSKDVSSVVVGEIIIEEIIKFMIYFTKIFKYNLIWLIC